MNEETEFLSDLQCAYYLGRNKKMPLGGVSCHVYIETDGMLEDIPRLQKSWSQLIKMHPALRRKYLPNGTSKWADKIHDQVKIRDLTKMREGEVKMELNLLRNSLSHRLMKIEEGEVISLQVSKLPGKRTRMHFDMDLIAADVRSFQIILRDLARLYSGEKLTIFQTEKEYAHWEKAQTEDRNGDKADMLYWKGKTAGIVAEAPVKIKMEPEGLSCSSYDAVSVFIEPDTWAFIKKEVEKIRIDIECFLAAALGKVLAKQKGMKKILLNMPVFKRTHNENLVGDYNKLLMFLVDTETGESKREYYYAVGQLFREDMRHLEFDGIKIQKLIARNNPGKKWIAPVVFSPSLDIELGDKTYRDCFGEMTYMISQTPQVWLDVQAFETCGKLWISWVFPEGLMDCEAVKMMADDYKSQIIDIAMQ